MGASQLDLFWKIVLPGTLPSIFTGAAVGMGITWEVVLAAEMISGGGTQGGGGLGFFIWNSYMGGSLEQIVVGMISIGIAGYLIIKRDKKDWLLLHALAPFILDRPQAKTLKHSEFELPEKFHGNNKIKKEGDKRGAFKKANSSSVSLKGVSKSYGEEWQSDDVLKDVSVDFPAGN